MEGGDKGIDCNSLSGEIREYSNLPEFSNLQSPATGQIQLD